MNHRDSRVNGGSAPIVDINDYVALKVDSTERHIILTTIAGRKATIAQLEVMAKYMLDGTYDRVAIAAHYGIEPDTVSTQVSKLRRKKLFPPSRDEQIAQIANALLAEGFNLRSDTSTLASNSSTAASNSAERYNGSQFDGRVEQLGSSTLASNSSQSAHGQQFDASVELDPRAQAENSESSTLEPKGSTPQSNNSMAASNPRATTTFTTTVNNKDTEVPYILGGVDSRAREGVSKRQARLIEIAAPILKDGARSLQHFEDIEVLIANGLDFELDVIPGVTEVTRKARHRIAAGRRRPPISTWHYFIGGINDHASERALKGQESSLAARRDPAAISPSAEPNGAQAALVEHESAQAQDLTLTPVLTGELIVTPTGKLIATGAFLSELKREFPHADVNVACAEVLSNILKYRRRGAVSETEIKALIRGECAKTHGGIAKARSWGKSETRDFSNLFPHRKREQLNPEETP